MGLPGEGIPRLLALPDGARLRTLPLSPVDGFLLSRIDGVSSVSDLASTTGVPAAEVRTSLVKLRDLNLVAFTDATSPAPDARPKAPAVNAPPVSTQAPSREPPAPLSREREREVAPPPAAKPASVPASASAAAAAADIEIDPSIDLDAEHQRLIQAAFARLAADVTHYEVLGVPRTADKKAVKRAYFELASRFHPDKFFRKNLGPLKVRMEALFARATEAYETLTAKDRRPEYDAYLAARDATRGLEATMAGAVDEVTRAEEAVRRSVSIAPPQSAPLSARVSVVPISAPAESRPSASVSPVPSPSVPPRLSPTPSFAPSEEETRVRRETLARRLTGGTRVPTNPGMMFNPSSSKSPTPPPTPTSPSDAVEALRRRYEARLGAARLSQARKYAESGASARAKGDLPAAANAYRVAFSFAPEDADVARAFEETTRAADQMLADGYVKQAEYEEKAGRFGEAAKSWQRVARGRPDDLRAHDRAARALMKGGGNLREAGQLAQRAVSIDPKDAGAHLTLAEIYAAAGLTLNAKREAEVAAQLSPQDPTVEAFLKRVSKGS